MRNAPVPTAVVVLALCLACAAPQGEQRTPSGHADSLYRAIADSIRDAPMRWHYWADTSAMDGSISHYVAVDAPEEIGDAHPSFILRCKDGETNAYVTTGALVFPDDDDVGKAPVRTRIDSAPPVRERWDTAVDHEALFSPHPVALARLLLKATELRVEFTPYEEAPQTARFDVSGLDALVPRIAVPCGWKA